MFTFDNNISKEDIKKYLFKCIKIVNEKIKLNVPINIDVKFGTRYNECH